VEIIALRHLNFAETSILASAGRPQGNITAAAEFRAFIDRHLVADDAPYSGAARLRILGRGVIAPTENPVKVVLWLVTTRNTLR
jgi:hypothetical protein